MIVCFFFVKIIDIELGSISVWGHGARTHNELRRKVDLTFCLLLLFDFFFKKKYIYFFKNIYLFFDQQ